MGENKDKLKGKAKEIVGTATGNRRMQAEGLGLQARGAIRGAAKDLKKAVKRSAGRRAPRPDPPADEA